MNIAFISAVLPVLLLLWFIYRKDKMHPEPIGKLLITFFVGCLSVLPAILLESLLEPLAPSAERLPVLNGLYCGYVVAGFSEELCKLVLLLLVIWRSRHFDEYFDGIVYAVYLSLGFACVENIGYVMGGEDAIWTALLRGLLAVPAHFLFAVTMGYYISLAKFDPVHRKEYFTRALIYPLLLHGTYDSLLMISANLEGSGSALSICLIAVLFIVFIIFDIRMWRWGLKRIKRMQERSREQDFDPQHPFDGFIWNV